MTYRKYLSTTGTVEDFAMDTSLTEPSLRMVVAMVTGIKQLACTSRLSRAMFSLFRLANSKTSAVNSCRYVNASEYAGPDKSSNRTLVINLGIQLVMCEVVRSTQLFLILSLGHTIKFQSGEIL